MRWAGESIQCGCGGRIFAFCGEMVGRVKKNSQGGYDNSGESVHTFGVGEVLLVTSTFYMSRPFKEMRSLECI